MAKHSPPPVWWGPTQWVGPPIRGGPPPYTPILASVGIVWEWGVPEGEVGRLCSLDADADERCTFCWLRRLEIEGLVDRWFMCKGNPGAWNEAEMESEERKLGNFNVRNTNKSNEVDLKLAAN